MKPFRQSTAVAARRAEPADSLDFFPTPPWATRALFCHVLPQLSLAAPRLAWDPACGEGHMALALDEFFPQVWASDIHPYGFGEVADFLHPDVGSPADWIITNPPFNRGLDFVRKALELAVTGVALLVRTQFLEGEARHGELFGRFPPAAIAQFIERVPMHRGRWVINGKTATAYCWIVWRRNPFGTWSREGLGSPFLWIPKSRIILSRHDDWLRFGACMDIPDRAATPPIAPDLAGRQREIAL